MQTRGFIVVALVALMTLAGAANAQGTTNEKADRATYNELKSKLRQIDRDYAKMLGTAMREAKSGAGEADLETQAKLISLRRSRDRLMNRLVLVASRHGWEVPDFEAPVEPKDREADIKSMRDKVFAPAADLVRARFVKEAKLIVADIDLPVVSLTMIEREPTG